MRRRVLEVEMAGPGSLLRGPGARELVIEATGRPPMWVSRSRGWSVQETTARDVIAAAEMRNYDIVVTGPRVVAATPDLGAHGTQVTDPGRGLW